MFLHTYMAESTLHDYGIVPGSRYHRYRYKVATLVIPPPYTGSIPCAMSKLLTETKRTPYISFSLGYRYRYR